MALYAVANANILFPATGFLESCYISQLNVGYLNSWLNGLFHLLFIKLPHSLESRESFYEYIQFLADYHKEEEECIHCGKN